MNPRDNSDEEFDETHQWSKVLIPLTRPKKSLCANYGACACAGDHAAAPTVASNTGRQNKFEPLQSNDDSDDEETEVFKALQQLTSKVSIAAKVSQKARKAASSAIVPASGLDHHKVAELAADIKSGKPQLPDLKCSNAEFEATWALTDACAGVNTANQKKHVPSAN